MLEGSVNLELTSAPFSQSYVLQICKFHS